MNLHRSFVNASLAELKGSKIDVKKSLAIAKSDIKESIKEYLSVTDRFSTRLKMSMVKKQTNSEYDE